MRRKIFAIDMLAYSPYQQLWIEIVDRATGRKYGVGLLVISQRTALVSKTILSQCNTFLTHSLIDQTSLNFLESVYSAQYVRSIPNLGRFQFLAAGKAIKAEQTILLGRRFNQAKKDAIDTLRQPAPDVEPVSESSPAEP